MASSRVARVQDLVEQMGATIELVAIDDDGADWTVELVIDDVEIRVLGLSEEEAEEVAAWWEAY